MVEVAKIQHRPGENVAWSKKKLYFFCCLYLLKQCYNASMLQCFNVTCLQQLP